MNLSLKRLTFILDNEQRSPDFVLARLDQLGYRAMPVDLGDLGNVEQKRQSERLLKSRSAQVVSPSFSMLRQGSSISRYWSPRPAFTVASSRSTPVMRCASRASR